MRYVLPSALGLIAATLHFIVLAVLVNLRDVHQKEKLFQNGKRLVRVAQLVEDERPTPLATARNVLARPVGSDGLNDAWGRPFDIAIRQDPSGGYHYIVRSLGADGMRDLASLRHGQKTTTLTAIGSPLTANSFLNTQTEASWRAALNPSLQRTPHGHSPGWCR